MRALLDHSEPFSLAHGGFQIQIEQTRAGLIEAGVDVQFMEWWNPLQKTDVIHFFGRPTAGYIQLAHGKGMKVVIEELLSGTGSRSNRSLAIQRLCTKIYRKTMPGAFQQKMAWDAYQLADACVANTPWEAHLMSYLFDAPREKIHVLPNGVERVFLESALQPRGQWLVCSATITERKRIVELAEAAVAAQTPLWIIGRPYSDTDSYAQRFLELARKHPKVLRYEGEIGDRKALAAAYRSARGFVLLSAAETRSLSSEEAAACECPLLLSSLPWARSVFDASATYCPLADTATTAKHLRAFYDGAESAPKPPRPKSWLTVGEQLRDIYRAVCARTS